MDKKITLSELIKDPNAVIFCPKLEQAEVYAKAMDKMGRKWRGGNSYLKNNFWGVYKGETGYWPSTDTYCSLSWYKEYYFKVYEFDDVDMAITQKKVGFAKKAFIIFVFMFCISITTFFILRMSEAIAGKDLWMSLFYILMSLISFIVSFLAMFGASEALFGNEITTRPIR
jgi:hypothetical protein